MWIGVVAAICVLQGQVAEGCDSDSDSHGDDVNLVAGILLLASAGIQVSRVLHRVARMDGRANGCRKERKQEDDKRSYAWEEDGYNGIKRVRVANLEGRVPWHKFANRTLSAYRAKRFRDLFRVPHVIFWEIHDVAIRDDWKEGDLQGTGVRVGRGTPIPLFYKVSSTGIL